MDSTKNKKADAIFERVLGTIKPSKKEIEETTARSNQIMGLLKGVVDKNVEIRVVGSIARATNLKSTADIDIFMLFEKKLSKDEIVKKGLSYAKTISKKIKHARYEIRYAEHPYARLYLDEFGIKLDLVPAYKLKSIEEKGTAVDRTPLHTDFVNNNLTDKQRDDVRLLKYLLKTHRIYGAEVRIKGFSGYLCELLVYNFGSLIGTMEFFSKIKLPICILPKYRKVYSDEKLRKKFGSEFIVVDPVDDNRNVAAIVSTDAIAKLSLISKMFLANPNIDAFYGSGIDMQKASKHFERLVESTGSDVYLIKIPIKNKTEDVIWPQLNKLSEIMIEKIDKYGFSVTAHSTWISGTVGNILYLTPKLEIKSRLSKGPSVFGGDFALNFIKSHGKAYGFLLKNGALYAFEDCEYTNAGKVITSVINERAKIKNDDLKLSSFRLLKKLSETDSKEAYANLIGTLRI